MPVTCSTSWLRIVSGSVSGCGRHVGEDRHCRRCHYDIAQRIVHRICGGLHQRAVERGRHWQRHRALGAHFLGHFDRAVDRALVAGDHDLRRVVVVGDRADLALGRRLGDLLRQGEIGAEQRRHRALPHRHRLLHRLPAQLQQLGRRRKVERARRARAPNIRRGCDRRRSSPRRQARTPSRPEHRDRMRHDCRLRILRELAAPRPVLRASAGTGSGRAPRRPRRTRPARPGSPRASAAPMPTAWLPCPGKMNARIELPCLWRRGLGAGVRIANPAGECKAGRWQRTPSLQRQHQSQIDECSASG